MSSSGASDTNQTGEDSDETTVQQEQPRRMSWIGVDYFQALRKTEPVSDEDFRKIPAHINSILCLRYSHDGRSIAVATSDGCIGIYGIDSGECLHYIDKTATASPATALRFRADISTESTNNVLLAVYTNGHITEWNYATGEKVRHLVETNQIMTVDYSGDFKRFATAGKDYKIRVYDESTGTLLRLLEGHANRVFSVHFKPADDQVLLSGGWDDNVNVWDLRLPYKPAGVLFGPHLCGDGLAIAGDGVLTAAWDKRDALKLWDLRKMAVTETCETDGCMLYTCQFSKTGPPRFAAGGVCNDEFRVYDREHNISKVYFKGNTAGTYSLDFSPSAQELAVAGATNRIGVLNIKKKEYREFTAVGFRKVLKA